MVYVFDERVIIGRVKMRLFGNIGGCSVKVAKEDLRSLCKPYVISVFGMINELVLARDLYCICASCCCCCRIIFYCRRANSVDYFGSYETARRIVNSNEFYVSTDLFESVCR